MYKLLIILLFLPIIGLSQQTFNFTHNGLNREYIYYAPLDIQSDAPLVFVAHGFTGSAQGIMDYCGMNTVADENGFVVCYPQGSSSTEKTIYTDQGSYFWNVGYEIHKNETVDDIFFLKSLAIFLQNKYNLDPEKTFCTGMSNGGDMSYLLGCEAPDIFKAIAPITGCMMEWIYESCSENDPVPVFQLHGTKDNTTYYEGDVENRDKWGAYMGVESTIKFWVDRNQCTLSTVDTLPDIDTKDGSYIIRQKYASNINKNEVWFYKIINGYHEWPIKERRHWGNKDINTSDEIWKFFSRI